MKELVSIAWLKENLHKKNLIILDSSLISTIDGKKSEFEDLTIPTARYFDIKANFSDRNSPLTNTIPTKKQFELECQKLGINNSSEIVIYDNLLTNNYNLFTTLQIYEKQSFIGGLMSKNYS